MWEKIIEKFAELPKRDGFFERSYYRLQNNVRHQSYMYCNNTKKEMGKSIFKFGVACLRVFIDKRKEKR